MITVTDENIIELQKSSDNAGVIYAVMHMSRCMGYSDNLCALISSAASELSTNILKYAGTGHIYIRTVSMDGKEGIEIEAVDSGSGIEDIEQAMTDNYSTGDSLGLGLQSVKRIMDEFEIKSDVNHGTMVIARKWK